MSEQDQEFSYHVAVEVERFDDQSQLAIMNPVFWDGDKEKVRKFIHENREGRPALVLYPETWKSAPTPDDEYGGRRTIPQEHIKSGSELERMVNEARLRELSMPNSPKLIEDARKQEKSNVFSLEEARKRLRPKF